jgi:hypothetical protein
MSAVKRSIGAAICQERLTFPSIACVLRLASTPPTKSSRCCFIV